MLASLSCVCFEASCCSRCRSAKECAISVTSAGFRSSISSYDAKARARSRSSRSFVLMLFTLSSAADDAGDVSVETIGVATGGGSVEDEVDGVDGRFVEVEGRLEKMCVILDVSTEAVV